jgi:hypothetical protein
VASSGTLEQTIAVDLEVRMNEFNDKALKYAIFNSEGKEMARGYVPQAEGTVTLASNMYLAHNGTATYTLIIWWDNTGYDQREESSIIDKLLNFDLSEITEDFNSLTNEQMNFIYEIVSEAAVKLEQIHKQKEIDFDEYLRFRTLTITKSLNISNVTSIIPFIDMFANDPIDYNVNFKLNETNNNLYVFTTKKVKRGDILYIRSGYFSNIKRFVLYGDTFEKMKDYIESFQIPMISSNMLYNMKQEEQRYDFDESIDLNKKKFYKKALKTYKKVSILNKEDGSDLSAYKLFLKNLELMRENYNHITTSDIHKEFVNIKDIYNVRRVLELEKKFLDGKLNVLRDFIGKLEKKSKKETENKVNKDL